MLAVMDQEFRCRKKVLSDSEMNDILAIIYSMPGAIGVNAALNIGYKLAGRKGSACALAGVLIPPVAIWKDIVIGLFAFLAVEFVDLPAVYVVVACGILGMLMYRGNEQ